MSLLTDLIPGGSLLDIGAKIIERFIPDPAAKAAAQAALSAARQSGELQIMLGQIQVDALEAASTNWFVAGWRPYIGWICGTGLGYEFLVMPIANGVLTAIGQHAVFVPLDTATLTSCLAGILGLGGLRTIEKHQGVEDNR